MLKELLGDLYTPEIEAKIGDKKLIVDDGKMVPLEKYNQLSEELKKSNGIIKDRDKQLDTLKASAGDNEELKKTITQLQTENTTAKEKYDAEVKSMKINFAIDNSLLKAGAVNSKAVRALLDLDKISLDGDNLLGFDEQLTTLKEAEKWAFTENKGVAGSGGNPAAAGTEQKEAPTGAVSF